MDFDKIKQLASEHPDQLDQGVEKGGDLLDEKTGGKYAGQVDQGQEAIRGRFGGGQTAAAADATEQPEQAQAAQGSAQPGGEAPAAPESGQVDDSGEPPPSP
jgi:hypothetical protein